MLHVLKNSGKGGRLFWTKTLSILYLFSGVLRVLCVYDGSPVRNPGLSLKSLQTRETGAEVRQICSLHVLPESQFPNLRLFSHSLGFPGPFHPHRLVFSNLSSAVALLSSLSTSQTKHYSVEWKGCGGGGGVYLVKNIHSDNKHKEGLNK